MGNNLKSRLHIHKKDEHSSHDHDHDHDHGAHASTHGTTTAHNEVDEKIMSGTNRARAADPHASDTSRGAVPAPSHTEPAQTTTTVTRGRP
ncbi:unnamed protein product [Adineta steineri]|uniref:Uncharacterized protein n=1 Tax=Adineta steineri TaxID=433720 RepID=A0A814RRT8_9BILA|nr:unnamed protein product [Adineta steineri]CAF4202144.1 unnamed protein product [Adineta steineri]